MTLRGLSRFLGALVALLGLTGLFLPRLLGMHLTPVHNALHLATGLIALYVSRYATVPGLRRFTFAVGLAYMAFGVLGFVAPDLTAGVLGQGSLRPNELAPDNA